jgi:hypothetical protein
MHFVSSNYAHGLLKLCISSPQIMRMVSSNYAPCLFKLAAGSPQTDHPKLHIYLPVGMLLPLCGRLLVKALCTGYRQSNTHRHKGCPEGSSLVAHWVHTDALPNAPLEAAARSLPWVEFIHPWHHARKSFRNYSAGTNVMDMMFVKTTSCGTIQSNEHYRRIQQSSEPF